MVVFERVPGDAQRFSRPRGSRGHTSIRPYCMGTPNRLVLLGTRSYICARTSSDSIPCVCLQPARDPPFRPLTTDIYISSYLIYATHLRVDKWRLWTTPLAATRSVESKHDPISPRVYCSLDPEGLSIFIIVHEVEVIVRGTKTGRSFPSEINRCRSSSHNRSHASLA